MADVKTLTVHGIPYSIKDETARNNIGTLQSTVSEHTSNISSIEDDVSGHTTKISSIEGEIDTLQSTVTGHQGDISTIKGNLSTLGSTVMLHTSNISSINSTLATKVTGDWFFNDTIPQADITIPQTPTFADLYSGNFNNAAGGAYLVTVTGLLFQGGQGNIEVMVSVNGVDTMIGTIPANTNLIYGACVGVVSVNAGDNTIKIKARATEGSAACKAYSGIFVTMVKVKN